MPAGEIRVGDERALSAQTIMLRRLRFALVAAVVIPTLLLVGGALDERMQLLHAAEADATATATALREHAVKAIQTHELLIRQLDRRTEGLSWDQIRSSSVSLSREIADMHAGMPEVSVLAITDAEGRRWAGSGPASRQGNVTLTHREYWLAQRDADRDTFISGAYVGRLSGRQDFGISRRRTAPDGRFDGIVHISVAASYFSDFWAEATADQSSPVIALLRLDGAVLARLPDNGDGPPLAMGKIGDFLSHVDADLSGGVFRAVSAQDGIERIYAWSRLGDYPLVVGYGLKVSAVTASWRQHLLEVGGVGALAMAALVLAVLAIRRQLQRLIAEQARRVAMEQAAQKSQRLELLGQLSAGIAHDFANILQAMGVSATLLKRAASQPERVRSLADRLSEDVERGVSLTQRMLDLVRQNRGRTEAGAAESTSIIDPTEAVAQLREMLPRLLSGIHSLRCDAPEDLPPFIRGDRSDLELAVMNLVVNARDAMPDGGEIVLRAATVVLGQPGGALLPPGVAPGPYVRMSVSDTGVGMSSEVLARAGSLFFTTKSRERGTGLGLAGARAFAERSGGMLQIDSREGHGTTVTLWLPAVAPQPVTDPGALVPAG